MGLYGRTKNEEVLNALVHLPLAVVSVYQLFLGNPNLVFLSFSFLTFIFSFAYHITSHSSLRLLFRRLDVASIFWLIPASVFHLLPATIAVVTLLLCITLSVPVVKSGASVVFTDAALIILTAVCLAMVFVFSHVWIDISLGVLFYALGLPFYFNDTRKWTHFVWHLFVIVGWSIHLWVHS